MGSTDRKQSATFLDTYNLPAIGSLAESLSSEHDISDGALKELIANSGEAQNILAAFGEEAHAEFVHAQIEKIGLEAARRSSRASDTSSQYVKKSRLSRWALKLGHKLKEAYAEAPGY